MGHSVVDGRILRLSVSQIEKFDPNAGPWGCNRRWWFRYVLGLPEPQTTSQKEGEDLHAQIEHYLKTGQDVLGPLARSGAQFIPGRNSSFLVEHDIPDGGLVARGIPFAGRIDLGIPGAIPEILDWKTTSSLRCAKSKEQLRESVQMNGYARYWFGRFGGEQISLTHVYFQKPTGPAKRISCNVDRETVTHKWTHVESTVGEMIEVAREPEVGGIPANRRACHVGRQTCPFFDRCPGGNVLDLLEKFAGAPAPQKPSSATSGDHPTTPEPVAPVPTGVLPPDAPKSNPELAADPVPGFLDVPPPASPVVPTAAEVPAKRKPGRPRKDSLPMQDTTKTPDAQLRVDAAVAGKASVAQAFGIKVDRAVIRKSMKIGLPNFSSAEVSVELGGSVAGNIEEALRALEAQVDAEVRRECAPLVEKKTA